MKSTDYLETTIPSFYYETRTDAAFVAMKNWTRQWWNERKHDYKCFISVAVLDELENGNHPKKDYLLTWNCNHLANANKKKHVRRINERLRLSTPEIITPLEVMEE